MPVNELFLTRVGEHTLGARAGKYKLGPGPVYTNRGPGPVNTNWGPGPVNTNWGPGPGPGGQVKGRGRENTNTLNIVTKRSTKSQKSQYK